MLQTKPTILQNLARTFGFLAVAAAAFLELPALAAPPANDDIANAVSITEPLPFTHSQSTAEAAVASDPVGCFESTHTVWYSYTPTTTKLVVIDTFGSDYDTVLEVFHGSPGDLYSYYECSDDAGGVAQSGMALWVNEGETIYIMAGSGNGAPGGSLVLNVKLPLTPPVVTMTVVEPALLNAADGSALLRVRIESSEPVTVSGAAMTVVQSSGRSMIGWTEFATVEQTGTSFEVTFPPIRDRRTAREHGTGFTGGPARVIGSALYLYGGFFGDHVRMDTDVKLRGGAKNP